MTSPAPAVPRSIDSDQQLVELAVAGDQRAFELLVIKYQRRVERLVGRLVRDVDLVPDITQETFCVPGAPCINFAVKRSSIPGCTGLR